MKKRLTYILDDEKEISLIRECLNYCYHRATQHTCFMTGKEKLIDKLRKELCGVKE